MKRFLISTLAVLALGGIAHADPIGEWRVADGSATVQIKKCGSGICGFVASTKDAPGKDVKNPDPAKRNRSVLGIEVLISLKPNGDNIWSGYVYNAEEGQIYTATVSLAGQGVLRIDGCVPNGGICGHETWTRIK
ncbi:DUF2147 domain-containing protein [Beijerinckia indica]|uniref:DUF2147 domain-containing protein n=1 Tax=Beijerinckia indica subsp. indica (strain ATCC 9039 / DSM 1715 / NCIMB 8712) TaxID=395963 RepID=B2ICR6_BEII9|nr:DUF2147 domain-containing protein [Beijerinckia indica]ACB95340.1 conserved hypothetical protein [Beijerinckia indica subsp. indica ATCC 9039]